MTESALWCGCVPNCSSKAMVKRNILTLLRVLLLLMTRACRTTSTVALQVIAGTKPMELEIIENVLVKRIKRNMNTTWEGNYYREKEMEHFHETLSVEIERIRLYTTHKWQSTWQEKIHARETYNFIPIVTFALRNRSWFVPNRFVT